MSTENTANIQSEKKGHLAIIEFSSPPHNSLTGAAMKKLAILFDRYGNDSDTQVIIIKSGGERTFCAGADFNEMVAIKSLDRAIDFFGGFANLYYSMISCPKIIISKIQGKTVGGGIGIIAASDLSYACPRSEIRLSELIVGIGPFVVGPVIQRKIGQGNLTKLSFAPNTLFSPEWAMTTGLFAEIAENQEMLQKRVMKKAEELISYNPAALTQIKRQMMPDLTEFKVLLERRKKMSAELLLTPFTQQRLKELTHQT